jgi:hypothetical protein
MWAKAGGTSINDDVSNVRFSCQATRCECEIVLEAHVTRRSDGKPLYEYDVGSTCPKCGHRLFAQHRARPEEKE